MDRFLATGRGVFDERTQAGNREGRDVADAMAGRGGHAQAVEPFHLTVGVKPSIGVGTSGRHSAITLFPNADDVWRKPGQAGDGFDRVMWISHQPNLFRHISDKRQARSWETPG